MIAPATVAAVRVLRLFDAPIMHPIAPNVTAKTSGTPLLYSLPFQAIERQKKPNPMNICRIAKADCQYAIDPVSAASTWLARTGFQLAPTPNVAPQRKHDSKFDEVNAVLQFGQNIFR